MAEGGSALVADAAMDFAEEMTGRYVRMGNAAAALIRRIGEVADRQLIDAIRPELLALRAAVGDGTTPEGRQEGNT